MLRVLECVGVHASECVYCFIWLPVRSVSPQLITYQVRSECYLSENVVAHLRNRPLSLSDARVFVLFRECKWTSFYYSLVQVLGHSETRLETITRSCHSPHPPSSSPFTLLLPPKRWAGITCKSKHMLTSSQSHAHTNNTNTNAATCALTQKTHTHWQWGW